MMATLVFNELNWNMLIRKIIHNDFYCLDAQNGDCLLHGYLHKLGGPFLSVWQKKYFFLYPNRLEYRGEQSVN